MTTAAESLASEVGAALGRGDPRAAAQLLRSHLADAADPDARLMLAQVLQHTLELDEARHQIETALREFTEAGLTRRAAVAAAHLGALYLSGLANRVASRTWLARAWRLVEDEDCLERGWVAIMDVGCNADDPDLLRHRAELALDTARRFGDGDLEAKALADSGLALVELGLVGEGMARVDEAIALVTAGAVADHVVAGQTVCSLLTACWCAGDLGRLESWADVLREHRLIGEHGIPLLNAHCDSVYGTLLCDLGRWAEAESVLTRTLEATKTTLFVIRLKALCAMAELRVRQGRLDEAEQLLLGHEDHVEVLLPLTRLHLARGDYELAVAAARRGLRLLGDDHLRAAHLLQVLVEAELGRGELDAAKQAAAQLSACANGEATTALAAEAAFARARVHAAGNEHAGAVAELETALANLGEADVPLLRAKLHLELARLHGAQDRSAAIADATAAAAIHSRIDAPLAGEGLALLHQLGIGLPQGPTPSAAAGERTRATLERSDSWWTICCGATSFRLRHTKGLSYLADLVAHPGVQRHVFDLVAITDPTDAEGDAARRGLGDAGPALDATAKNAYRRRLEELRDELETGTCARRRGESRHAARRD